MSSKYTLEVISHLPKFNNKSLRKYHVDGIDTVGVWGNEPFEIRFKNHTSQKLQVKISLDGTDVFTGKPADTQVSDKMWVVNGYETLNLKAWPETNNGGAQFVFTSAGNSVAVHTHGDLSSRGIIAAAVFTEGYVEPIRITEEHHHHHHDWSYYPYYFSQPLWINTNDYNTGGLIGSNDFGVTYSSNSGSIDGVSGSTIGGASNNYVGSASVLRSKSRCSKQVTDSRNISEDMDELVAIGAGEQVEQNITYVTGLIKPVFAEAVRVKYMWWDDLLDKLREGSSFEAQPTGFPGDKPNIDLKGTPRIGKTSKVRRTQQAPVFSRV